MRDIAYETELLNLETSAAFANPPSLAEQDAIIARARTLRAQVVRDLLTRAATRLRFRAGRTEPKDELEHAIYEARCRDALTLRRFCTAITALARTVVDRLKRGRNAKADASDAERLAQLSRVQGNPRDVIDMVEVARAA